MARITDEGLRAIGINPNVDRAAADTAPTGGVAAAPQGEDETAPQGAPSAPTPAQRASLQGAAAAILSAWDDEANRESDIVGALDAPMAALRTLLAGKPARTPRDASVPRKPREGTKQEQVLAMLRRTEGPRVAQIAEVTGWAQHTVRSFLAGLKKKGHAVEVKSRERMVGPNKTGAKGSFTIYALAE